MLTCAVFAAFALHATKSDSIPIQIVPASQSPLDRKDQILESSGSDPYGLFLLNDFGVSDKAYEAVVKNPGSIQVVELIRKEASGQCTAWLPNGKPTTADDIPANSKLLDTLEVGDVAMVMEGTLVRDTPSSTSDKPLVQFSLGTSKRSQAYVVNNTLRTIQLIGKPVGKFANIRLNIRVIDYVGSFSAKPGTTATVEGVTYKVGESSVNEKDKRTHLDIQQIGIPNIGGFSLRPLMDWTSIEQDQPKLKNRNYASSAKATKTSADDADTPEYNIDLSANKDLKYWTEISVIRSSNIAAYLGHIAMEPVKGL
ncbi:MAG: hypothetical protein JST12_02845 [Armatimonadetes bacterium]|nr:hypothetical protein [Armatimonadota bacterium]MBS1728943.1 hypothetical protein [Armatimonadota bacterium]